MPGLPVHDDEAVEADADSAEHPAGSPFHPRRAPTRDPSAEQGGRDGLAWANGDPLIVEGDREGFVGVDPRDVTKLWNPR
jgi:hypothetical protein